MKMLIIILATLVLMVGVAGYSVEITAPLSTFETQTSTSVNISGSINASAYPDIEGNMSINVTIMNKSTSTGEWGVVASSMIRASNTTHPVFWNQTVTLGTGYSWIRLNFTNVSVAVLPAYTISEERIINVDPDQYKIEVGGLNKINFTLDTGLIQSAYGIVLSDNDAAAMTTCPAGTIIYNTTSLNHKGCNGTGWHNLY